MENSENTASKNLSIETVSKLNLYEKIQKVSNEIRNLSKNMQVGTGSYAYKAISDIDVTLSVKDAETMYRLTSIPVKQEIINSEILKTLKENNKESFTYVDTIKLTLRIINLDNISEFVEVESFGKGIDNGDKGFGKASTYARKYALLNAYKIATGEDPDTEKSKETKAAKTISEKRILITNYLNSNNDALVQMLKYWGIESLDGLTEKQVETIYKSYLQKKLI